MKLNTICFFFLCVTSANCQDVDIDYSTLTNVQSYQQSDNTYNWFSKGFLDIFTNGKMQATSQLLRIDIGNKEIFYIPLCFYVSASGNGLGSEKRNENAVANLLNPLGGFLNINFNGRQNLKTFNEKTSLKFVITAGHKIINAQDSLSTSEDKLFFNSLNASLGLRFETEASSPQARKPGIFWLQAKPIVTIAIGDKKLNNILGDNIKKNYLWGYSLDLGIEIDEFINLKFGVYQFLNIKDIDLLKKPSIKFSVDYKVHN